MVETAGTDGDNIVKTSSSNLEETLKERRTQHGPFQMHAQIECQLHHIVQMRNGRHTDVQKAGLSMIMHKIARILNGGNNHSDSWHDIAGYATLVEQDILDE
jgi:hypothetical protein